MHALALLLVLVHQFIAFLHLLLSREVHVIDLRQLRGDVGQDEELVIAHDVGQQFVALVGHLHALLLLVDDEEERIGGLWHAAVVVLHIDLLGLEQSGFDSRLGEIFDQRLVLWQSLVGAEEAEESRLKVLVVARADEFLRLGQILSGELALCLHQFLHDGLVLIIHLLVAMRYGTRDDERCTGIVDQHGIDLIDNGEVVGTLHQVVGRHGHVVAQVVETELIVGTEGDIGEIGLTTLVGVGPVLVDAIDTEAVEHIERSHPLGVTLGEVVVDGHHMHTVAREGVEEDGQCGDKGLTFTCRHLGDLALVQHHASEELNVVVDHIPDSVVTSCHPVVVPDGLVAVYVHEVVGGSELAVEVGGSHLQACVASLHESACCVLDDGEDLRKVFVEFFLKDVEDVLLDAVNLVEQWFSGVDLRFLDLLVEFLYLGPLVCHCILQRLTDIERLLTEFVVAQLLHFRVDGKHLIHDGLDELEVARTFVAEHLSQKT